MAKRNEPIVDGDTISTGIYVKKTIAPKRVDATDVAAMREALEAMAQAATPRCTVEEWLEELRSTFAGKIRPYATASKGGDVLDLGDGYQCYTVDASKAEPYVQSQVADAIEGMTTLRLLGSHIQGDDLTGNAPHAIQFAYKLGRLVERLRVRVCEPLALSGRKSHIGGKSGAGVTNEAHKELHAQYQVAVESLMASEGISYSAATERVAVEFVVSTKTVQRRTTNPAPRNQGRPKR